MKYVTVLAALFLSVNPPAQGKTRSQKAATTRAPVYPAMVFRWKGTRISFEPFYDSGQARTRAFLRVWRAGLDADPRLLFAMYGIWYRYGLLPGTTVTSGSKKSITLSVPGLPVGRAAIYARRFGVKARVNGKALTLYIP